MKQIARAVVWTIAALVLASAPLGAQTAAPAAGSHHVHLNSVDPAKAVGFYLKTFDVTKRTTHAGFDGVQSENIYVLFSKVATAPAASLDSAIWHVGWGSPDMEKDYARHLSRGVMFATPITKLPSGPLAPSLPRLVPAVYRGGGGGARFRIMTAAPAVQGAKKEEKVDVTGNWEFQVETSGGGGSPTFVFKQEGEKLTGRYKGLFGEADLKGTVKGTAIEFSFTADAQGTSVTITYKGTVEKDTMKGTVNISDLANGTFTGKRSK